MHTTYTRRQPISRSRLSRLTTRGVHRLRKTITSFFEKAFTKTKKTVRRVVLFCRKIMRVKQGKPVYRKHETPQKTEKPSAGGPGFPSPCTPIPTMFHGSTKAEEGVEYPETITPWGGGVLHHTISPSCRLNCKYNCIWRGPRRHVYAYRNPCH